jgi:hypothetical protein
VRKTIRRGLFLTATAACALGFGFTQASASPVPPVPTVPELPLSGISALTNLGQAGLPGLPGLPEFGLPAVPEMPALPSGQQERVLPGNELGDLVGLSELTDLKDVVGVGDFTDYGMLTDMAGIDGLPGASDLPGAAELPTEEIGLPAVAPSALPVGLEPAAMPELPTLPSETSEITKAPVVQLPSTERVPLVAQIDHNDVTQKLVPNTDGVDVQGLPKPQVPDVASATDVVKLPATKPATPGMESVGVPSQLPVVPALDTTMPSLDDLTGGVDLPTQLPELPAV